MAEYGLKIKTATGYEQIDSNYTSYSLLSEGSAYVPTTAVTAVTINFTNQPYVPIIMVKLPVGAFLRLKAITNNSFTVESNLATIQTGFTFQYRVFSQIRHKILPSTGYGLRIKNASNEIVFDSNELIFKTNWEATLYPTGIIPDSNATIDASWSVGQTTPPWVMLNNVIQTGWDNPAPNYARFHAFTLAQGAATSNYYVGVGVIVYTTLNSLLNVFPANVNNSGQGCQLLFTLG